MTYCDTTGFLASLATYNAVIAVCRACARTLATLGKGTAMASNIVFARVDDRLIHAQITAAWNGSVGANVIVVANDEVATSKIRQSLMDGAVPSWVHTRYYTITDAVRELTIGGDSSERIFLVVESPADMLKLVEGGVEIEKLNIGNLHITKERHPVTLSVAVGDEDVAAFKALKDKGIELSIQRVPGMPPEDAEQIFA